MPVYEFACNACGASVSVFVRSMSSPVAGKCGRCGSTDLRRLISKFAVVSHKTNLEQLSDTDFESIADDPQAAAAWARQMRSEMGGDQLGPEFDEMIEHLDRGESLNDLGLGEAMAHEHDHGGDDLDDI
jgi:putative FmdB family regulatory protein